MSRNDKPAQSIARTIGRSNLVKLGCHSPNGLCDDDKHDRFY
ncbi:hypothetical protein [Helicobacter fennelliae]|nr:hypothetical protein [Helicobacter fennelliae]